MPAVQWYHVAMVAGGALAVGGAVYLLMREDKKATAGKKTEDEVSDVASKPFTKEQVLKLLNEIIDSQDQMKAMLRELTKELMQSTPSFEEIYQKVKSSQPDDPIERLGLTMPQFDRMIEQYHDDMAIREAINQIMGSSGPMNMSAQANSLDTSKIIEVHKFMVSELKAQIAQYQSLPNKADLDFKIVTIVVQALVGARVEAKFGVSPDDIESAVMLHHQSLQMNPEFTQVNVDMQSVMSELVGSQFPYV